MNKFIRISILAIFTVAILSACKTVEKKTTLRSIDIQVANKKPTTYESIKPKSAQDIRNAYTHYLSNSMKTDNSRRTALSRLAELEFEVSNKLILSNESSTNELKETEFEKIHNDKLNNIIELFNISLRDYPDVKGNDKILYQLAKAYDQKGEYQASIDKLSQLIAQYSKSKYYIEAQFRLAEANFIKGNYIEAENGYTEILVSPRNQFFYEKAIFKRGWTRFKQSFYEEALDDFLQAISYHKFDDFEKLNKSDKDQFKEYFRAIGLSFSNLGGAETINSFFEDNEDFKYKYYTYSIVSDLYLKQERISDAVNVLQQFINFNSQSKNTPYAQLKIVEAWQQSPFTTKLNQAIESFYLSFNIKSKHWKTNKEDSNVYKSTSISLKKYVLLMSEYFHSLYQKQKTITNYASAKKWYQRYLDDYLAYARKDNIYFRFAELLSENKHYSEALRYYELAAYDDELILDKNSAYATILLTDKLYKIDSSQNKSVLLDKHIKYSQLFAQLYLDDKRSTDVIAHASELSYLSGNYQATIELANLLSQKSIQTTSDQTTSDNVTLLKAQAHFNLKQYSETELTYLSLLKTTKLSNNKQKDITDRMALAVYKLASQYKQQNKLDEATQNYMRIATIAPSSDIASTGMYDAIALYMSNEQWLQAISAIENFQTFYPKHKYSKDITKKLSIAYLNSDQSLKAAAQFEKISSLENNKQVKMTALWQAAEIYETKENYGSAVRSYTEYANNYKKPYSQYMESMLKLVELYSVNNNRKQMNVWQKRILNADRKSPQHDKNERTKYIVAVTNLRLARQKNKEFDSYKLVEPLKVNLRKKKKVMQQTIKLFGQASTYGIAEITTESTFAIAEIYQNFSVALLDSERPKKLKGEDLEQYNILLEDQAFPFEDKAIEFHEINISRIKDNVYDDWVSKSLTKLKALFPVKYDRKSKVEGYINVLQ